MKVKHRQFGLPKSRLDTLVDGVYAFALTLLVLDVRLPDGLSASALPAHYVEVVPKVAVYCIAFFTVAFFWVCIYWISSLIERTDLWRVLFNIGCLLLVALVPFTASTLGHYPGSSLAVAAYCFNISFIGLLYSLSFGYSAPRLIPDDTERKLVRDCKLFSWGITIAEGFAGGLALSFDLTGLPIAISAAIIFLGYGMLSRLEPRIISNVTAANSLPADGNNDGSGQARHEELKQELLYIREQMKRLEAQLSAGIVPENVPTPQERKGMTKGARQNEKPALAAGSNKPLAGKRPRR